MLTVLAHYRVSAGIHLKRDAHQVISMSQTYVTYATLTIHCCCKCVCVCVCVHACADAAKRRQLPAWIRDGLEKMEREKQRQLEKERQIQDALNAKKLQDDAERDVMKKMTDENAADADNGLSSATAKSRFVRCNRSFHRSRRTLCVCVFDTPAGLSSTSMSL